MTKTYRSAVDTWLAVLLFGLPVICVVSGALLLPSDLATGITLMTTGIFVAGIVALFAIPCVYTLSPTKLTIRAGVLSEEIPLEKIHQAEPSSSVWSAPALSLRRVRLTLADGTRLISPRERETFLTELKAAIATRAT